MDHDARCEAQDRALALLEKAVEGHEKDIEKIVEVFDARHRTHQEMRENVAEIKAHVVTLREDVKAIKQKIDQLTPLESFVLLRNQWYYFVGLLATGVVLGMLAMLISRQVVK